MGPKCCSRAPPCPSDVPPEIAAASREPAIDAALKRGCSERILPAPEGACKSLPDLPCERARRIKAADDNLDGLCIQVSAQLADDIGQQVCAAGADERAAEMPVGLKWSEAVAAKCLCNGEGGLAVICLPEHDGRAGAAGAGKAGQLPGRGTRLSVGHVCAERQRVPERDLARGKL